MVVCSGVLHHMRDPMEGWKQLIPLMKDGGIMKIALYSEIARRNVIWVQNWIKEKGFAATRDGISNFRQESVLVDDVPELRATMDTIDFYSTSMCRDLLFHVQEHVYTLPEIGKMIDSLDLNFIGLTSVKPFVLQQYKTLYPDDPKMINLDYWHAYEQQNLDTFSGMYNFWCQPKDSGDGLPDWVFVK